MIQQTGIDLRGENVVDVTDESVPAGELLVPVPLKLLELVPLNLELVLYLRRLRSCFNCATFSTSLSILRR